MGRFNSESDACDDDASSTTSNCTGVTASNSRTRSSLAEQMLQDPRPRPLTSLTVSIKVIETDVDDKDAVEVESLLFSALVKREMVGQILCLGCSGNDDPDDDSSEFFPFVVLDLTNVCLKLSYVDSLPKVKVFGASTSVRLLVLPSTRITVVERTDDDDSFASPEKNGLSNPHQSNGNGITGKKLGALNNAGQLLLDTIKSIAEATRISNSIRERLNVPRAFCFTGPPGVGKTHSIRQVMDYVQQDTSVMIDVAFESIRGSELLGLGYGDTEAELRRIFTKLASKCGRMKSSRKCSQQKATIGLVFLDECEALLQSQTVSAQLGVLLDRLSGASINALGDVEGWGLMIVVVATNRLDSIPAFLRRPGRLDREVPVNPPKPEERLRILKNLLHLGCNNATKSNIGTESESTSTLTISELDLKSFADDCVGYVAADLSALIRRAVFLCGVEYFENNNEQQLTAIVAERLTIDYLRQAMCEVGASALRDAALSAPPTTRWEDIGGDAGGAKQALRRAVEWPRTKKEEFSRLGLIPPRGILLHGPPGCAKTTLARAAAGSSGIAFFSLSPADVFSSSYVGEAEAVIRRAFALARAVSPCLLFFDEIDSILGGGGNGVQGRDGSSAAENRVLSTFLNEMDGVDTSSADGVLVLGATNRPSTLDAALLRPGRFDRTIYVPPPDETARRSIFALNCGKWMKGSSPENDTDGSEIDIISLSKEQISGRMTGAEIEGACQDAAVVAMKEALRNSAGDVASLRLCKVRQQHLENALKDMKRLLADDNVLYEYKFFEEKRKGNKVTTR